MGAEAAEVANTEVKPLGKDEQRDEQSSRAGELSWTKVLLCASGALFCLFFFLLGLDLMGSSFKVLGGRGASDMFTAVDNPIAGLMTGVLSTVLVQSSSTSTSIVVAMVGEQTITVPHAIPIIMGANIGTSVTNTIVSMGQSSDRIQLERAFAGATVHDMFNILTVATLLPVEVIIGAIQGHGGPLYWLTYWITEHLMGHEAGSEMFDSPLKLVTGPIIKRVLHPNKHVIYALTLSSPEPRTPTSVNTTSCQPLGGRRLSADGLLDCGAYYCVSETLDHEFEKISKSGYEELLSCEGLILDGEGAPCGEQRCYVNAGEYYQSRVADGRLIKDGFLEGAGDVAGGIIALVLSLLVLCAGLVGLCKCLQTIFMGSARRFVRYATRLNDYVALLIGLGITIVVQSSSVTTSALTPLVGLGVLPLAKMLPMSLGANIGTTCTALLASLVSLKFDAVQIALCHLFFNIFGISIWFPVPRMRRVPLGGARLLGLYASYFRAFPVIYILVVFVGIPGVCLGISAALGASLAGGLVLLVLALGLVCGFEFLWWVGFPVGSPLCYRVLSKEQREAGVRELARADAECRKGDVPEAAPPEESLEASVARETEQRAEV